MKILKTALRIIFGIVFTFSGFVKAVDPTGFEYMITDYFTDAFGMASLSSLSLTLSVLLNSLELLVGICLIVNVKPRLAALGGLIFMVIYTPLTLYIAIANPVSDCGCFGDAIKLTNWETFFKNLILFPIAIYLFTSTKGEKYTYKATTDWSIAVGIFSICVLFQVYSLNHLPIMDFRPYKVGIYIPDQMIIPEGEKPDSFTVSFTYKHLTTGEVKELDEKTYMESNIWEDTLWQYVKTSDAILVQKGYEPPIYNFKAYPVNLPFANKGSNDDVMDKLLENKNYSFFIVSYDLEKADMEGFNKMAELINYAYPKEILANLLTSTTTDIMKYKSKIKFPVTFYNTDPITLKTIIRSNPGLLLMKEGKIIGKWHYNDIPSIEKFEEIIKSN